MLNTYRLARRRAAVPEIGSLETKLVVAFVLLMLGERAADAYELRGRLLACGLTPAADGVAHTLRRLEADGFLDSDMQATEAKPEERVYELTAAGHRELDRLATTIAAAGEGMDGFLGAYARLGDG
jgi:DNA-binding PadR family transcriptional regulator